MARKKRRGWTVKQAWVCGPGRGTTEARAQKYANRLRRRVRRGRHVYKAVKVVSRRVGARRGLKLKYFACYIAYHSKYYRVVD